MSISIRRYVDITSGVGASAGVARRELIGRLFSDNPKTPADAVVEFDDADEVAAYYGAASEEAKRAAFYFGFISKSITAPKRLGFARWAKVANEARIYGAKIASPLSAFQAIVAGALSVTVGGQTANLTNIDLSTAVSFADVASEIEDAFQAAVGSQFGTATVAYDATAGAFNFTSGQEVAAAISVVDGALADLLGWTDGAVLSPGVGVTTVTTALANAVAISNNFGSFAFVEALTTAEVEEAATWNAARNVEFMFCARTSAADAATLSAELLALAGTALTLATLAGEYDELVPMMILAATDYDRRNAVQNYMFQTFALTPKVSDNVNADLYDALRVNYYGNTQTAGQQINFYQRGVLMGGDTAPTDMNTYANEIWLKDRAQSAIMALLLAVPRIPANVEGRGQILAILQEVIDAALFNGVISIGKTLTQQQRLFIGGVTGDPDAYHQVQNIGYWADVVIQPYETVDGRTEYKALYTLVYSKDDTVRKVEGQHVLI